MSIIKNATISPMPKQFGDPMPVITAELDDGSSVELFSYYPDELHFTPTEFIGLSVEQGRSLKFNKDRSFLQS